LSSSSLQSPTSAHGTDGIIAGMLKMVGDAAIPSLQDIVSKSPIELLVILASINKGSMTPLPKIPNSVASTDLEAY